MEHIESMHQVIAFVARALDHEVIARAVEKGDLTQIRELAKIPGTESAEALLQAFSVSHSRGEVDREAWVITHLAAAIRASKPN